MAKTTPQQAADKWAQNLGNSTTSITNGVNAVTVAPAQKAAQNVNKWLQNVQNAKDKYVSGLSRVTLESWKSDMLTKGLQRISSGANSAKPKFAAFMNDFLPFLDGVKAKVDAMPSLTLQDNINRMITQVTEASKFTKKS